MQHPLLMSAINIRTFIHCLFRLKKMPDFLKGSLLEAYVSYSRFDNPTSLCP